jgi:arginyl-tRNA synthetase
MSGRLGRYVTLIDVLDKAVENAYHEVDQRMKHLGEKDKHEIARKVGYGAVKFTMLSVDPMKTVIFDWARALDFESNSAPFIQYSHARACNILKRVDEKPRPNFNELTDQKERILIYSLAEWPEIFLGAAEELKPMGIATYLNSLAEKFNSFYASLHVLYADTPGLKGARIALVEAVLIVLRNALNTLCIEAPEQM